MADLTKDQKLTLLASSIKYVYVRPLHQEGLITVYEYFEQLGVPIDVLLEDALPLSSPPYTRAEFEQMMTVGRRTEEMADEQSQVAGPSS